MLTSHRLVSKPSSGSTRPRSYLSDSDKRVLRSPQLAIGLQTT